MAAGALNWAAPAARVWSRIKPVTEVAPRRVAVTRGMPEIYFEKTIDNSRLVKVADPRRTRDMMMFAASCSLLFLMAMFYAWQHFSAVEYGYRIEQQKAQRESMVELNRELRLEEAALRDPERIDVLARRMGLQSPEVGQVQRIDNSQPDAGGPVLARYTPPATEVATLR
jgi:hypothetical protein